MTAPRRAFLAGLAALGASTLLRDIGVADGATLVAADSPDRFRIDTHHHVFPPTLVAALSARDLAGADARNWSLTRTLDDMDRAGVATAVLSVTTPAVSFVDAATARRLARECNEWVAGVVRDHPGRFGSFATIPVQEIDAALAEIQHALDVLHADGIALLTSYGDKWLGHATFAPVMSELNRRGAVLYTHPTAADCCRSLLPDIPPTIVEYGTDTSRTITDIVFSGTAARSPGIHFVFSHAGGTLPYLTERLTRLPVQNPALASRVPNGVLHELTRFYYDTAWAAHPMALASLLKLVPISQVLFGSDYPYRTGADNVKGLADYGFSATDLRAIGRENAIKLLPRLQA